MHRTAFPAHFFNYWYRQNNSCSGRQSWFYKDPLKVNLYESSSEYLVLLKMSDYSKDKISIALEGEYLNIRLKEESIDKDIKDQPIAKQILLEKPIIADSIKAKEQDGIVHITIQKQTVAPSRSIEIA